MSIFLALLVLIYYWIVIPILIIVEPNVGVFLFLISHFMGLSYVVHLMVIDDLKKYYKNRGAEKKLKAAMVELHVCPKCNQTSGWKGLPYQGVRWAKLKAIAFHLKRGTLFSRDYRKNPFLKCCVCGYVVNGQEYSKLTRRRV